MKTSVSEAFRQFRTNLDITSLQESTSTRQTNVRNVVARDLVVLETFLTGSFHRNTVVDRDHANRCALAAEYNLDRGLSKTAIEDWRAIFSDKFPLYG